MDLLNITRKELRESSSAYLNSISNDELFSRFGISRVSRIDGLDFIGLPVYSACRPAALRVSVSAGKSRDPLSARAGSIAEGIEFHTFENPTGDWTVGKFEPGPLDMPTGKSSVWTPKTEIALDRVTHFMSGEECWFPSSLIWIRHRRKEENYKHFMGSTNGNAVGPTLYDALIQGICELIERDQVTLRIISTEHGIAPPCIDVENLDGPLGEIRDACEKAGSKIYLMNCNSDINVPVFWSVLVDNGNGMGRFAGYGCHYDPVQAAERAMLEAVQSRLVYVAGARDDILRRDHMQNQMATMTTNDVNDMEMIPKLLVAPRTRDALKVKEELGLLLHELGDHWRQRLFYKAIDLGDMWAVKVIIPGMEQIRIYDWWRPMRWHKLRDDFLASIDESGENPPLGLVGQGAECAIKRT